MSIFDYLNIPLLVSRIVLGTSYKPCFASLNAPSSTKVLNETSIIEDNAKLHLIFSQSLIFF